LVIEVNQDIVFNNFQEIIEAPNGIKRFNDLVLELAVSGKLRLKSNQIIDPDTGLPNNWCIKSFSEIASFTMGKTPPTKDSSYWADSDSIMWVSIADMHNGETINQSNKYITKKAQEDIFRREPWPTGTLLMSFKLTIGKVARLGRYAFFNEAIFDFDTGSKITNEYLFRVLPVLSLKADSKGAIKGNTLNSDSIRKMLIPLPPIDEQEMLIKIIDEISENCKILEQEFNAAENYRNSARESALDAVSTAQTSEELHVAWERIQNNWEVIAGTPESIESLRMLVLDLAIKGNLTSKTSHITGSSTKTQESSFSIPVDWKWCTLQSITEDLGQETPVSEFSYIDVASIDNKAGIISKDLNILSAKNAPSRARKRVTQGSVLYSTVRPYLRNIAIIDREFTPQAIASTAFAVLHPIKSISPVFLFFCLRSNYFKSFVESKQKGVAYPAINGSDLKSALLPIPPMAEQEQIIRVVTNLLNLCDQLENELSQKGFIADKFLRSITAITG
jgi:type I restriction enzyme S subunit